MVLYVICRKWRNFGLSTIDNLIVTKISVAKRQKASHLKIVSMNCPKKGWFLKTVMLIYLFLKPISGLSFVT